MHYYVTTLVPYADDVELMRDWAVSSLRVHEYSRYGWFLIGGAFSGCLHPLEPNTPDEVKKRWSECFDLTAGTRRRMGPVPTLEENMILVDDLLAQGEKMVVPAGVCTHHGYFFSRTPWAPENDTAADSPFVIPSERWGEFVRDLYSAYSGSIAVGCDLCMGWVAGLGEGEGYDHQYRVIRENRQFYEQFFKEHTSVVAHLHDPCKPPEIVRVRDKDGNIVSPIYISPDE